MKFVRKGEKGFAILAGDTFPIDVYSHLPCVFEDNEIPYVFVPSKHDLGAAIGSKRPTCVLLIKPGEAYMSDFGKTIKVRIPLLSNFFFHLSHLGNPEAANCSLRLSGLWTMERLL